MRKESGRVSDFFPSFEQPFVGFVGGGLGKPIEINQSKIKKAKDFFQDFSQDPAPSPLRLVP